MTPSSAEAIDNGQAVNVTAAVSNDSGNKGVTWGVTGVGTLSNQTATTATYTAPASGTGTGTITATSVADTTKTASVAINVSAAPSITTTSLPADTEGAAYNQTVVASGGAGTLTFSLSNGSLPAPLTLSGAGAITGTPTGPNTTSNFTVKVTDSSAAGAQSATQSLSIAINLPAPPTITTSSLPGGTVGTNYNQALAGTCPSSAGLGPCTWSVPPGTLPAGLSLNAGTGAITGKPTGPASATAVNFTVTYADNANPQQSAQQSLSITISNPPAPLISPSSLPNGTQGTAYSQQLTLSNGASPFSGWAVTSGTLPGGLNLTAGGGNHSTATISGIPNSQAEAGCVAGPPEVCTFTISVNDSSNPVQTASQSYTVTFAAPAPLTYTGPPSLPGGTQGTAYGPVTITASGGIQPYTFGLDISSSPFPNGISIDPSTGIISGTPTVVGTFNNIIVDVTDSTSTKTGSPIYSITIAAPPLSVTPTSGSSLPGGTQGTPYTTTITASGGVGPYTFAIDGGGTPLPSWATFTANSPSANQATITGTPNASGTTSGIILDVTDSEASPVTIQATYSLAINAANPCLGLTDANNESMLTGSYVFVLKGFDNGTTGSETAPEPVGIGGILTFNGVNSNGLITGGVVDQNLNGTGGVQSNPVTSGSYIMDASDSSHQRACLTINTGAGTQHYRVSLGNISGGVASTGHMIDFDGAGPFTAGTLRKQTATSLVDGNYAFGVSSAQNDASCNNSICGGSFGAAGVFQLAGGVVNGGTVDFNNNGQLDGNSSNTTWPASADTISSGGAYTFVASGRGTLTFTPGGSPNPVTAVLYAVNSTDALILNSDDQTSNSLFAGELLKQSGGPFANSSLNGATIISLSAQNGGSPVASKAAIGLALPDGSGTLSTGSILYQNNSGTLQNQNISGTTYAADASGDGRVLLTTGGGNPPVFWMVSQNQAFVLGSNGGVESGVIVPQSSTTAPSGTYAFGTIDPQDSTVDDNIGVATFSAGNVSGTSDDNSSGSTNTNQTFSSMPVSVDSTGLGLIGPSGCIVDGAGPTGCQLIFYIISPNHAVLLNLLDGSGNPQTNPALQVADQ